MDLSLLPQYIVNALTLGAIYALLAIGYTMVYGIVRLINLAHGDIYMLGAFIGFGAVSTVTLLLELPGPVQLVLAMLAAFLGCALVGMAIERFVFRPIRTDRRTGIAELIAAIGVGYVIQNGAMVVWGPNRISFPSLLGFEAIDFLGARATTAQAVILVLAPIGMLSLYVLVRRTRVGMAMRASAADPAIARLMGIDVERVILFTFAIAGAFAGIAGVLVATYYGSFFVFMGVLAGLKAFTAAVMGGIGSIPGAMIGGFALGGLEVLGTAIFPAEWKDLFAFVVLILLLTARPTGIIGEKASNRV